LLAIIQIKGYYLNMITSYIYYNEEGDITNMTQRDHVKMLERNVCYIEDDPIDEGWSEWEYGSIEGERKHYGNLKIVKITNKEFEDRLFLDSI